MLDPRIYRAALLPVVLAVIVAAFSVELPPPPLTAALPPDSFSGERALQGLDQLARAFPSRQPGGDGDAALARRVRDDFEAAGFRVRTRRFDASTARGGRRLTTVIGERTGLSSRQIVLVASRDALARPATASLTATGALLELARVFEGRTLRKSLVLVSTSGGSGGSGGAAEVARNLRGPVDAVLVLGDMGGRELRRPLVVPWSTEPELAPGGLRATVAAAVRLESGLRPGDPGLLAQFARQAFPLTVGEQGELLARGLPAVLLSVSGERGPRSARAVGEERFQAFGRAALRSITALDARPLPSPTPSARLTALGKQLPGWAISLLVATLILPAVLAAVDGFARMRRRRHPVGRSVVWVLAAALPFLAAAGFAHLLVGLGLLPAAPSAFPVGAVPLELGSVAILLAVVLVGLAAWLVTPRLLALAGAEGEPASPGAAAALSLVLVAVVAATWAVNPFAAALLLAPLHGWMLLSAPEVHVRRGPAVALIGLTLLPIALVVVYYCLVLGAGPLTAPWNALLIVVGGPVGALGAISWALLAGCLVSLLAIVAAKPDPSLPASAPSVRGPAIYAGPGSLGATESALRR